MKAEMPSTWSFLVAMRAAFGSEPINALIARGLAGEPDCFHATENGHTVGTPFTGTDVTPIVFDPQPRADPWR